MCVRTFRVHEPHCQDDEVGGPLLLRAGDGLDALGGHLDIDRDEALDVALRRREGGREGGRGKWIVQL